MRYKINSSIRFGNMALRCFAGLIAILLMSPYVRAQGTVQISSVSIASFDNNRPVFIVPQGPGCRWVTARIAVQKEQSGEDPTVTISFRYPTNLPVQITPSWISATLSGSTAFHVLVCSPIKTPGRFVVEAAIPSVGPAEKFKILPPNQPSAALVELSTPIP